MPGARLIVSMWAAQWVITGLVVLGFAIAATKAKAWTLLSETKSDKAQDTASVDTRKDTWLTMQSESPRLHSFKTSEFLLGIALDLYEKKARGDECPG
jgi:hypothetical protein